MKVCCQKSSGIGKSGTVIWWCSLAIMYQSPHFRSSRNLLPILISLLRLEKVTSCSSQHRCLCSAPGQEQCRSLHLGLKQLQLPYLKFGEVVTRAGASHTGACFWCGAVWISARLGLWNALRAAPLCLSLSSFNSGAKIAKIRKDVCCISAVLQH